MTNKDTIHLLKECDAGSKMAVSSIDDVLNNVSDQEMKQLLVESKNHHKELGAKLHLLLNEHGSAEKDPAPMAKGMSWMKTNMKLTMDDSDATIADLMTDGCNMGIKSLHKYKNQYKAADQNSHQLCDDLISIEEQLCQSLRKFL